MKKQLLLKDYQDVRGFPFGIHISALDEPFAPHGHDFSELIIAFSGTAEHRIDGRSYPIRSGDVFVIKGDSSHQMLNVNKIRLYNLIFDPERFFREADDLKQMPGYQCLFVLEPFFRKQHQFRSHLFLEIDQLNSASSLCEKILDEYTRQPEGYQTRIRALFTELVISLSRRYMERKQPVSRELLRIADAVTFMEAQFLRPITLDDIARRASLSNRHFIRLFKENYGTTPVDYLIRLRIEHACRLMKSSDLNITEIAFDSGFSDSNYFSRKFREVRGMAPREYRKLI